ncbi:MAG: hypothetical protein LBC12_07290 [Nitrososphaerota archaeon]|jgi:hypothetical protein|nr:hypothetical protein [Nitrososphaerota archaeon]
MTTTISKTGTNYLYICLVYNHLQFYGMSLLLAIVGVVVFLLTEDMSLSMCIVDKWAIANVAILIVEIMAILFVFKAVKQLKSALSESTGKNMQQ